MEFNCPRCHDGFLVPLYCTEWNRPCGTCGFRLNYTFDRYRTWKLYPKHGDT